MKFPFKAMITNLNANVAGSPGVAEDMLDYLGEVVTVLGHSHCGRWFHIQEDFQEYVWHPSWFKTMEGKVLVPLPASHKKPTASKHRLSELLAELRKGAKQRSDSSVYCHYGLVVHTRRGYELDKYYRDVCHARIASYRKDGEVVALIDFAGSPRERMGKDYNTWLKYSDFIINRSYVKGAFIPTRMSDYVQHGVKVNVEATNTNVMTGLNALRMGREHKDRMLPTFKYLTSKGFDEGVAFLMGCSFFRMEKDDWRINILNYHTVIPHNACVDKLVQVAAGTFEFPKGKPYREKPNGWRVFKSVSSNKRKIWSSFLRDECIKRAGMREAGWGVNEPYPLTDKQFLEVVGVFQEMVDKEKSK